MFISIILPIGSYASTLMADSIGLAQSILALSIVYNLAILIIGMDRSIRTRLGQARV
jgi:hypothetical protein